MAFVSPLLAIVSAPRRFRPTVCMAAPTKTLVTGASGRTGHLTFERLCSSDRFEARGMVRSIEKASSMVEDSHADKLVTGDVLDTKSLESAFEGMEALIILTSSVPKLQGTPKEGEAPTFYFPDGETPEDIDWEGSKNQIDVAARHGVKHIVFVGSMGSTNPNHPLNRIGNGNILKWKRKAEQYLIDSGIDYTVINPGGLLNEPAGKSELILDRNDRLFKIYSTTAIPRGDVAELCAQAVLSPNARNKAFDVVAKPERGSVTSDFDALFALAKPGLGE